MFRPRARLLPCFATFLALLCAGCGKWLYTDVSVGVTAATPTFTPPGGSYTTAQQVAIVDATPGASIYYTTDGTIPTAASKLVSGTISVSTNETINAIAAASGYNNSGVGSAIYTFTPEPTAATPTFTPPSGSYTTAQQVTITDATPGASVYYTTNGTTPSASSTFYSGPLTVANSQTVEAIAISPGYNESPVATASYNLPLQPAATPTFNPPPGIYSSAQSITISDSTPGAVLYYTTDGSTPTTASSKYTGPFTLSFTDTVQAIAVAPGYSQSAVAVGNYAISYVATGLGTWTWMGGSKLQSAYGVYGTQGVASASNMPGARSGSVSWTDSHGNFWLFGGYGFGASGTIGLLNDLWEFDPTSNQWTWISGSYAVNQPGVYGALGVASAANVPGARDLSNGWIDSAGNLWLFGGMASEPISYSYLNDLWQFNVTTQQWTWISGSNTQNAAGVYGTKGIASATNVPGSRSAFTTWIDSTGSLWLFGGSDEGQSGQFSDRFSNDLWKFDPAARLWTWVSGSSVANQAGVYGTMGKFATDNIPGNRGVLAAWVDPSGNFWLFGGSGQAPGIVSQTVYAYFSDVWEFSPSIGQWVWQGGPSTTNSLGSYDTPGVAAPNNSPGSRASERAWKDNSGNVWIFGGETGSFGRPYFEAIYYLDDLWKYDPKSGEWAWMSGDDVGDFEGNYGVLGVAAVNNYPGARSTASTWVDSSGNLWMLGGVSHDPDGYLNDLWRYQP